MRGLLPGVSYSFKVLNISALGMGNSSQASTPVSWSTVPDPPTNVSVSLSGTSALISSSLVTASNGSPISAYRVEVMGEPLNSCTYSMSQRSNSCTVTGLARGRSYQFQVLAVNGLGSSSPALSGSIFVPPIKPDAPVSSAALWNVATPTTVVASWASPAYDGGSRIDHFTATAIDVFNPSAQKSCNYTVPASGPSLNSCVISGLWLRANFVVKVTASNGVGSSDPSPESNIFTPVSIPPAPSAPMVTARGDGTARVTIIDTRFVGGSIPDSYLISSNPGNRTCAPAISGTDWRSGRYILSCTFTGLANGIDYIFRAQSVDHGVPSPLSDASVVVTPVALPAPQAQAGDHLALVNWTAPSDLVGKISSYVVTTSPGGATCSSVVPLSGQEIDSCKVLGLENGLVYSFVVTYFPTGAPPIETSVSNSVTPASAPSKPTSVSVTTGDGSALVHWSPATVASGPAVRSYTASASPGGLSCTYVVPVSGSESDICTISGLTGGVSYSIMVIASNGILGAPASDPLPPVVATTVPDAPTGIANQGGGKISWLPGNSRGSRISSYQVMSAPSGYGCAYVPPLSGSETDTCTVTGLPVGVSFSFSVIAINAIGASPSSALSAARTSASAPSFTLQNQSPSGDYAAPLSQIYYNSSATAGWNVIKVNGFNSSGYLASPSPTGSVTLYSGDKVVGTQNLVSGSALFSVNLNAGLGQLHVAYSSTSPWYVDTLSPVVALWAEYVVPRISMVPVYPNGPDQPGSLTLTMTYPGPAGTILYCPQGNVEVYVVRHHNDHGSPTLMFASGGLQGTGKDGQLVNGYGQISSAAIPKLYDFSPDDPQELALVSLSDGGPCAGEVYIPLYIPQPSARVISSVPTLGSTLGQTSYASVGNPLTTTIHVDSPKNLVPWSQDINSLCLPRDPRWYFPFEPQSRPLAGSYDRQNINGIRSIWFPAIDVCYRSAPSAGIPVWLLNSSGQTVGDPILTDSYGNVTFTWTPDQAGWIHKAYKVGSAASVGAGISSFSDSRQISSATSASIDIPVEPAPVSLSLSQSNTPFAMGQATNITLALGSQGQSGAVNFRDHALSGITGNPGPYQTAAMSCSTSCSASAPIPSTLLLEAQGGGLSIDSTYLSDATGLIYTLNSPVARSLPSPTVTSLSPIPHAVDITRNTQRKVSWSPPASATSATFTYRVTATPGGKVCNPQPDALSCTFDNLARGSNYSYAITAITDQASTTLDNAVAKPVETIVPQLLDNQVPRDQLQDFDVQFTYPFAGAFPNGARPGGSLLVTATPKDCAADAYCKNSITSVSVNMNTLAINVMQKKDGYTPSSSASWSGTTLSLHTQAFIGGMDFTVNAMWQPIDINSPITGSSASLIETGIGDPSVAIAIGSATAAGGHCQPHTPSWSYSNGSCAYRDASAMGPVGTARNPQSGQIAFVKASFDQPTLLSPRDRATKFELAESNPGDNPYFFTAPSVPIEIVPQPYNGGPLNVYDPAGGVQTLTASPQTLSGADDLWNGKRFSPYQCSDCRIWPIASLDSTNPFTNGGNNPGTYQLGLIQYAANTPDTVISGSPDDLNNRNGLTMTSIPLTVDPTPTQQASKASYHPAVTFCDFGPPFPTEMCHQSAELNVVTAARWPTVAPLVQINPSEVMATVTMSFPARGAVPASTMDIAYCTYDGFCARTDLNGDALPAATTTVVNGQMTISMDPGVVSRFAAANWTSATLNVETTSPWGSTVESGPISLDSGTVVGSNDGPLAISMTSQYLATQLENPDLNPPGGAWSWDMYESEYSFWSSIFGDEVGRKMVSVGNEIIKIVIEEAVTGGLGMMIAPAIEAAELISAARRIIKEGIDISAPIVKKVTAVLKRMLPKTTKMGPHLPQGMLSPFARLKIALSAGAKTVAQKAFQACGAAANFGSTTAKMEAAGFPLFASNGCVTTAIGYTTVALGEPNPLDLPGQGFSALQGKLSAWYEKLTADKEAANNASGAAPIANDIGYGWGTAAQFTQFFSAMVNTSIPGLAAMSPAQRDASTVTVNIWGSGRLLEPLATCTLSGVCVGDDADPTKSSVKATMINGTMELSGIYPQNVAWQPPYGDFQAVVTLADGRTLSSAHSRINFPGNHICITPYSLDGYGFGIRQFNGSIYLGDNNITYDHYGLKFTDTERNIIGACGGDGDSPEYAAQVVGAEILWWESAWDDWQPPQRNYKDPGYLNPPNNWLDQNRPITFDPMHQLPDQGVYKLSIPAV
ncbi:MAG: fibronectin type III domain-containing protein [Actinobacteria bacterium]|nr:fibronectin type III domain-containing protein [Actinomycetota bacterium]